MVPFRRLLSLVMVAVLALTAQGLAVARGQGAATGYVVICAGGGMAMVPTGPDGQPAGPAHFCPDGVLTVAPALAVPQSATAPETFAAFTPLAPAPVPTAPATLPAAVARAPPAAV